MKDLLVNQIVPTLFMIIASIVLIIVKDVGKKTIEVLQRKKEEIEQKMIVSNHEHQLMVAKEVWNIVEEKFRITEKLENLVDSKADLFESLLQKRFPSLTKEEFDYLRHAIAGEVNKEKGTLVNASCKEGGEIDERDRYK